MVKATVSQQMGAPRMKCWLWWLVLGLLVLASGCAYYQKQAIPHKLYTAPDMETRGLMRGEHVIKTRYGFRLFTIPITMPEPNVMVEQAITEFRGVGITDLEIEFSEFNIWLFAIPKVRITGDIVREPPKSSP
jgi:hypothetical protein